jgi:hypothetical protein
MSLVDELFGEEKKKKKSLVDELFGDSNEVTMRELTPEMEQRQRPLLSPQEQFGGQVSRFTDNLVRNQYGDEKIADMQEGKRRQDFFLSRAPRMMLAAASPLTALAFEVAQQAKNYGVAKAKDQKYDPMASRQLAELLPEKTPPWLRTTAGLGEMVGEIVLMSKFAGAGKIKALKKSVSNVNKKLPNGQVVVPEEAYKNVAKTITPEQSLRALSQSRKFVPGQTQNLLGQAPINVTPPTGLGASLQKTPGKPNVPIKNSYALKPGMIIEVDGELTEGQKLLDAANQISIDSPDFHKLPIAEKKRIFEDKLNAHKVRKAELNSELSQPTQATTTPVEAPKTEQEAVKGEVTEQSIDQQARKAVKEGKTLDEFVKGQRHPVSDRIKEHRAVEWVDINEIDEIKVGGDRATEDAPDLSSKPRKSPEIVKKIIKEISEGGKLEEPLEIRYSTEEDILLLGEGNHRLAALKALGWTHVPTIVNRTKLHGFGVSPSKLFGREIKVDTSHKYLEGATYPRRLYPSELGFKTQKQLIDAQLETAYNKAKGRQDAKETKTRTEDTTGSVLSQQARKAVAEGKTVEEFVKGQGEVVYRGENAEGKDKKHLPKHGGYFGKGTYYATNREQARLYTEGNGKLLEGVVYLKKPYVIETNTIEGKKEVQDLFDGRDSEGDVSLEIKKQGYDGIVLKDLAGEGNHEIVSFNKDAFTTKQQLTEAYNKAKASTQEPTLTEKLPVVGKETLSKDILDSLNSESGFINMTGEIADVGVVKGMVNRIHKNFTRHLGLPDNMRQSFIEAEESIPSLQDFSTKIALNIQGRLSPEQRIAVDNAIEQPDKYQLEDQELIKAKNEKVAIQDWSFKKMKDLGYFKSGKFPENKISYIKEEIDANGEKITELRQKNTSYAIKSIEKLQEDIQRKQAYIKKLERLGYVHRVANRGKLQQVIQKIHGKRLTSKPTKFMKRQFDTREEGIKAGVQYEDPTVGLAETIFETKKLMIYDKLIKAINGNESLTLPEKAAPDDWLKIDDRLFPKGIGKKYHPNIADAIKELTLSDTRGDITRAYDYVNTGLKMVGFYNPLVMTWNDLQQGWRASGVRVFTQIPGAIKEFINKGEHYQAMEKAGDFNTVLDYKPALTDIVNTALDRLHKTLPKRMAEDITEWLNPVNFLKDVQTFNNAVTWNIDRILRVATDRAAQKTRWAKGMTEFQRMDMVNDFMASYSKVPKETRRTLNRGIFVPTYKISMIRVLGKMAKEPKKFSGPIARQVVFKTFMKWILPSLVAAHTAAQWKKKGIRSEGYRLVIPENGGKEKVFSFSGPLLEETKLLNRPLKNTLQYNLAAVPHALTALFSKQPTRHGDDKFSKYFKLGTPVVRDVKMWKDKDKSTLEKMLQQAAVSYSYTRKRKPAEKEDRPVVKLLKDLDLWIDPQKMFPKDKQR